MVLNNAVDIRLGETAVAAVYLGETLVWTRGPIWGENIFNTLTFSGGWLGTDGNVNHQTIENYGTSDYFLCGDSTKVRVSFTPQYTDERGVMVCAYDKDHTFIGSAIYEFMRPPYPLTKTVFFGDIPNGAVYLRYSYLWGKYNRRVPSDLDSVVQLEVSPEITLGTWDDLAALTWDDASAYTWNEIGGN